MLKKIFLNKTQIFMGIFTIIILALMAVIFYQLMNFGKNEKSVVPIIKTRAANKTYKKEITLNFTNSPTPFPESLNPTQTLETPLPTKNIVPSPTLIAKNEGIGGKEIIIPFELPELSNTPTPTDIIVAKISPVAESVKGFSPTPTGIKSLPKAGYFYYNIFLFAVGLFIIIFSLVI